jgi:hypothetical protein
MVLNHDKRCVTVGNGEGRWGTVRDGEGLWCHDDGLWVTPAENWNGTVTVTGQNHNFYFIDYFKIPCLVPVSCFENHK